MSQSMSCVHDCLSFFDNTFKTVHRTLSGRDGFTMYTQKLHLFPDSFTLIFIPFTDSSVT